MLSLVSSFVEALRGSADVMNAVNGRIYAVGRTTEDDNEDRVPYIIISYQGAKISAESKDDEFCGDAEQTDISVLLVYQTFASLVNAEADVRNAIKRHLQNEVLECSLSVGAAQYDSAKPCYYIELKYSVYTNIE